MERKDIMDKEKNTFYFKKRWSLWFFKIISYISILIVILFFNDVYIYILLQIKFILCMFIYNFLKN